MPDNNDLPAEYDAPGGGAYSTAEHLRAQNDQIDDKTLQPLTPRGANEPIPQGPAPADTAPAADEHRE